LVQFIINFQGRALTPASTMAADLHLWTVGRRGTKKTTTTAAASKEDLILRACWLVTQKQHEHCSTSSQADETT